MLTTIACWQCSQHRFHHGAEDTLQHMLLTYYSREVLCRELIGHRRHTGGGRKSPLRPVGPKGLGWTFENLGPCSPKQVSGNERETVPGRVERKAGNALWLALGSLGWTITSEPASVALLVEENRKPPSTAASGDSLAPSAFTVAAPTCVCPPLPPLHPQHRIYEIERSLCETCA